MLIGFFFMLIEINPMPIKFISISIGFKTKSKSAKIKDYLIPDFCAYR